MNLIAAVGVAILSLPICSCKPVEVESNKGELPSEVRNSFGMRLRLVPVAQFIMGSPSGEANRQPDENRHEVTLTRDFYMSMTEVTQSQYEDVMGSNPAKNKGVGYPVENVTWNNAVEFCRKLTSSDIAATLVYRLPTEAEWEYACRAGRDTSYYWQWKRSDQGDILIGEFAWYDGNANGVTHMVGQKRPNAFGLFDMCGNVGEWCADWYGLYPAGSICDPEGPSSGPGRVFRGGSYVGESTYCRSASRLMLAPDFSAEFLGFRVVAEAPDYQ